MAVPEEYFEGSIRFSGDCYVADYTDRTDSKRGVEMSESPFDDIDSFHLKHNKNCHLEYIGVNFEHYPHFIKGIQNCECMFHALSDVNRPWTLFLEMKYCDYDNIEGYAFKAYSQMKDTFDRLTSLDLIDPNKRRLYFVYSIPEHEAKEPFGAFTISQNDTLKTYEESGIKLLGNNTMLIAIPSYLFEQKAAI